MLVFEDVDREKEVLVELSSIVAIEESNPRPRTAFCTSTAATSSM